MGELRMPSLGADMVTGTLVAWRCKPGDVVHRGDIVAEVETDKGVIEIESFESGVVDRLLIEPGTRVPVGTPMATFREGAGEPASAATPTPSSRREESGPWTPTGALLHEGASVPAQGVRATPYARMLARESGVDVGRARGSGTLGTVTPGDVPGPAAPRRTASGTTGRRTRASPRARRLAAQRGVDVGALRGTGPEGAVTAADVEAAGAPGPELDAPARMRRAIGAAMARSKREVPHYYLAHTLDMGPALAWLEARNAGRSVHERVLPAVLLLRAATRALEKVPELNARWEGEAAPPLSDVHLGCAVSLRGGGLVAPAIFGASGMSLDELMEAFRDLVARVRTGRMRGTELTGATITVTSLGDRGVESLYPIIVPPQVAIVGFGRIVERPWVVAERVVPRPVVTVTLAADHRVSDGHRGGLYVAEIERLLTSPEEP